MHRGRHRSLSCRTTISFYSIMFGLLRRKRPIIPTRLPEHLDPAFPEGVRREPMRGVSPVEIPVADTQNDETPPLTPGSDTAGDASTDEPSVEEQTVQEACKVTAESSDAKTDDNEISSDDTPDSEEMLSDSEDDNENKKPHNRVGYKSYLKLFNLWSSALAGGLLAYYINTHQDIITTRAGDTTEEVNLLLVPREKWDDSIDVLMKPTSYEAQRVVVLQTDTEPCDTTITCSRLLNAMKRLEGMLKYNFFISTDGCIYEALGWQEPSSLYPDTRTMVVGFIGNYETLAPSTMQLTQFQSLLEASQELNYLSESYTIVGKTQAVMPSKLFAYLSGLPRWDKDSSDGDEQYMNIDFEPFPLFDD